MKLLAHVDPKTLLADMNAAADVGLIFSDGTRLGPRRQHQQDLGGRADSFVVRAPQLADVGGDAWLADATATLSRRKRIKIDARSTVSPSTSTCVRS